MYYKHKSVIGQEGDSHTLTKDAKRRDPASTTTTKTNITMDTNPAYGTATTIKMDTNPAYGTATAIKLNINPAYATTNQLATQLANKRLQSVFTVGIAKKQFNIYMYSWC